MTKRYLVKNNMLYKIYKNKWGKQKRYFIDFDSLMYYHIRLCKREQLIDKGLRGLHREDGRPLPDSIQKIYKRWIEKEVESLLTGE